MPWDVKKISNNSERLGRAVRQALDDYADADKNRGRGYGSAATAVEQAILAFGNLNGYSICVETKGDISADGRGYLTISLRTIDPDVMV